MNDPSLSTLREIVVTAAGADDRSRRAAATAAALALSVGLAEVTRLLSTLPATLPRAFSPEEARALVEKLASVGASATVRARVAHPFGGCADHPQLDASDKCGDCGTYLCSLCVGAASGVALCAEHARRKQRSRTFYRVRVTLLLGVLVLVLLFAALDIRRRSARNEWQRSLTIAVVLVRRGPVDPSAISALIARMPDLEQRLADELVGFRDTSVRPFNLVPYGPVDALTDPPAPEGEGLFDLAKYAYERYRYLGPIDAEAGTPGGGIDARIYLVLRPAESGAARFVEGISDRGGRVGLVDVDLDASMVDFALFVATHELFHTVGATDKYDAGGRTLVPEGLAEPDLEPLFPQRFVEVMARNRPLSEGAERTIDSLSELKVGPLTAKEIGWVP